jgi:very-short-patch-repair endonuclease
MSLLKEIELIFENVCKLCEKYYISQKRSWYSTEEILLCEECFIDILSIEKCNGNCRYLCKDVECKKCYLKSFASHEKSDYWSENNNLTSRDAFKSSKKKYLFNCQECGHEFENSPHDKTWCPYCCNPPKKLCDNNNCKSCFKKSFASHEKSVYLSIKNNVNPRDIFLNSHKKYLFNCCECGHEIELSLLSVNSDRWCIYCGHQKLCDNYNCKFCFNNSFASHERSKYWSVKNNISPRQLFLYTGDKYLFKCECGYEFEKSISSATRSWCPICVNKTEKLINSFLLSIYSSTIFQYKTDWCRSIKTNRYFPFDFFIPELKLIIELDGHHHFEYVSCFKNNVNDNQDRDVYKSLLALQNGISMIRIVQDDVWKNKIDWKKLLTSEIETLKLSSEPTISYISNNTEIYREHISKMNIEDNLQNINFEEE